MLTRLRARMSDKDSGFTLIELLVVMIIIGILAAVAIPIFMNQQKTSRDTQTISDLKNVATNVQTMLVSQPDANYFAIHNDTVMGYTEATAATTTGRTRSAAGDLFVRVGRSEVGYEDMKVSSSDGTTYIMYGDAGQFTIKAWNPSGKNYTSAANAATYDSANGGLKK